MGRRVTHGALAIAVCLALGCTVANAARSSTPVEASVNAIIGGGRGQAIIGGDRSKTKRPLRSDAIIGGDIRGDHRRRPQQDQAAAAL